MNFDDFDITQQVDESFTWYDYEMLFGDINIIEEEEEEEIRP